MLKRVIRSVYHEMQQHYLSFRFLVWLKECGITRRVNYLISHSDDRERMIQPTKEMRDSKMYFENQDMRIQNMLSILADEKSGKVWERVVAYRTMRRPLDSTLYSEYDQYFCKDIVKLEDNEVFVDGGAYTGDTIQQFMDVAKKSKVKIRSIVAFEPEKKNFELLSRFYGKRKEITLIQKGLSKENKVLYLRENGVTSKVLEKADGTTIRIPVVAIDCVPECADATFIKMDIEGVEMDALYGAQNTIKKNHPKLAICIYHSDEDMIRIIEYIHELVPEYRLYVRHHSKSDVETVVYAVV